MVLKSDLILFIWIKIWSIFVWISRKCQTKGRSFSTKVVSGNILLSFLDIAFRQYVLFLNTVTCMIYVEFQKQWSSKFTNSFSKFASRIPHLMIAFCSWHFLPNMPCNMVQTESYFVKSFTGEASEGFNCILNKKKQLMVWFSLLFKALLELSRKKKSSVLPLPFKQIYLNIFCSVTQLCLTSHGLQPSRLLCPWDFPGKNTELGCHFLLQLKYLGWPLVLF